MKDREWEKKVGGGDFEYLNVVFEGQSSSALAVGQSIAVALIGPCSPQDFSNFSHESLPFLFILIPALFIVVSLQAIEL
jgi:hypothetical protein